MALNRCAEYVPNGSFKSCGRGGQWSATLLGYFAIFGTSLAAYSGVGPWVIAAGTIALASVSRAENGTVYQRGRTLSLNGLLDTAMLRSIFNGIVASTAVYGFGWLMRAI